jgi:hypothetical protein
MARISLDTVISREFIGRLQGLASGSNSENLTAALSGNSTSVTISDGLRLGAKTYSTAVGSLNSTIALVNVARGDMLKLQELTEDMIGIVERATRASTGQQTRTKLDREFRALANEFVEVIDNAELSDQEYLTVEGLTDIFTSIGLDPEASSGIAAVFEQFMLADEDDTLASGEMKGSRPVPIPRGSFSGPAADNEYQIRKLTDNSVEEGAVSGAAAVAQVSDDPLEQNPGVDTIMIRRDDGTVSTIEAGSLSSDIILRAVNAESGYSVIESTEDFLGYNAAGREQLFLLNDSGEVIHQVTNRSEAPATWEYVAVDIDADSDTIVYAGEALFGSGQEVHKVSISGTLGGDPSTENTEVTLLSAVSGMTSVKISDDGNYVAFDSALGISFYNSSNVRDTQFLGLSKTASADGFAFLEDNVLAVDVRGTSNDQIVSYRYGVEEFGAALTGELSTITHLDALQRTDVAGNYNELERISDVAASGGYIHRRGNIYQDGSDVVFESELGTAVLSGYTLAGVNENTGMAVLASSNDPLGYNPLGFEQAFLVGYSGAIEGQITDNGLGGFTNVLSGDVSDDGLTVAVVTEKGAAQSLRRISVLDADPAMNTSVTMLHTTTLSLDQAQISYDGEYIAAATDAGSAYVYNSTGSSDAFLSAQTDIVELGFTGSGELIVAHGVTSQDIELYNYADGSFSNTLKAGAQVAALTTSQSSEAYFAYLDPRGTLFVSDTAGESVGRYNFQYTDAVTDISLATMSSGFVEIGAFGSVPSDDTGDTDTELYRIRSVGGEFAFDYNNGSGRTVSLYDATTATETTSQDLGTGASVAGISLSTDVNGNTRVGIQARAIDLGGDSNNELYALTQNTRATTGQLYRRLSSEFDSLFDDATNIRNRADAFRVLTDLEALQEQISENVEALDEVLNVVGLNLDLVRETGLALLEIADSIGDTDDAALVARQVRSAVRENAGAALSQAENLEPMIVAALALDVDEE